MLYCGLLHLCIYSSIHVKQLLEKDIAFFSVFGKFASFLLNVVFSPTTLGRLGKEKAKSSLKTAGSLEKKTKSFYDSRYRGVNKLSTYIIERTVNNKGFSKITQNQNRSLSSPSLKGVVSRGETFQVKP